MSSEKMKQRSPDGYLLGDDGYVMIQVISEKIHSLKLSDNSEDIDDSSSDSDIELYEVDDDEIELFSSDDEKEEEHQSWNVLSAVKDQKLIELVNSESLTKENIIEFVLTDLVRGAYHNAYLQKCVRDYLGFRPLPLVTRVKNPDGNVSDCYLYPHQDKTIAFMREREAMNPHTYGIQGGIIQLFMGLGKTLTAISHSIMSPRPPCKEKEGENGFPTLIIASKTVMMEWKAQGFEKFFGKNIKVMYLHKDYMGKSLNTVTRKQIVKYDFVVTTYDTCSGVCRKKAFHEDVLVMGDDNTLMKGKVESIRTRMRSESDKPSATGPSVIYTTPWERVICDESQRFANPSTKTYRHIMAIYGRYKWCLTGTPIRNYETDIWAQLRFCGYNGVDRKVQWIRTYIEKMKSHNLTSAILKMDYASAGVTLPIKHRTEIYVTLEGKEKECYDYVQGVTRDMYDMMMRNLCDFACILALFTRLRQCSIAPYLLTAESKREKESKSDVKKRKDATKILAKIYEGTLGAWVHDKNGTAGIYSKKMTEIVNILGKLPKGEKILVFSMFTSVLDLLADACEVRIPDFKLLQIDGDTVGLEREDTLNKFRNTDVQGLFLTYKVGSEGLNLTEATHVICVEPWWTNAVHNQAESRCHRNGQTREVEVHTIYVKNSIEEKVVEICKEKDKMAEAILDGTGRTIGAKLDKYTLGRILGIY